jgi:hypothetical protein
VKPARIALIGVVAYVAVVVAFESLLGVVQPQPEGAIAIRTFDEAGEAHERIVTRIDLDGSLYVAANHWPRAWYHRALERPEIEVEVDGERSSRQAVAVEGAEHDRVAAAHPLPIAFRVLTGFPRRAFVRLDPR